jgi:ribonuclease BN (tRNA processing enzyme)
MTTSIRILGASGGIGQGLRTTSLLVNGHILVDAGTGVGDLTLAELMQIDQVFLTHAHLDHIACLPFLADAVGLARPAPIRVRALAATLEALRQHILNDVIWPDFTRIPSPARPCLELLPLTAGQAVNAGDCTLTPLPAAHSVPAVGYLVANTQASLAFSGDSGPCDAFWQALAGVRGLRHLILEASFPAAQARLAQISGHHSPATFAQALAGLQTGMDVWVTHLKPGVEEQILQEIAQAIGTPARPLAQGVELKF